jgi:hypothetical protein
LSLWSRLTSFRLPRLPIPVDLPPPTTFSEGQRSLFGCLASMAGMAAFVFAVWVTRFFMTHPWVGEVLQGKVIDNLGWALIAALAVMSFVTIGLLVGGPVGRFKGTVGKDGLGFEAEDHETRTEETKTLAVSKTVTTGAPAPKPAEPPAPAEEPFNPGGGA